MDAPATPDTASAPAEAPQVVAARDCLRKVMDPEVGLNIVDLGLIYGIEVDAERVHIRMTMTSPACPMGDLILDTAYAALGIALPDREIDIEVVWNPPWTPDRMTARGKDILGW